jgi:hypothetical protein
MLEEQIAENLTCVNLLTVKTHVQVENIKNTVSKFDAADAVDAADGAVAVDPLSDCKRRQPRDGWHLDRVSKDVWQIHAESIINVDPLLCNYTVI